MNHWTDAEIRLTRYAWCLHDMASPHKKPLPKINLNEEFA